MDQLDGLRWELALSLIESGEAPIRLGEVEVSRSTAGPSADGGIRLILRVSEQADREIGQAALIRGRALASEVASADLCFARLLELHGWRWEIVDDYGMGTVLLGAADRDGDLVWQGWR